MRLNTRRARLGAAVAVMTAALVLPTTTPVHAAPTATLVADGFAGPLGLAVGDDGTIYVGDAFAGQLTTIDKRGGRSVAFANGMEVAGVDARGRGNVAFVQSIFAGPPEGEEPPPVLDALLSTLKPNGKVTDVFSTLAFEEATNPDAVNQYGFVEASAECQEQAIPVAGEPYTGIIESHPYAVLIVDDGWLIADAAANAVFHVGRNGRASTLAVLPPVPNFIPPEVAELFGIPACAGETYYGEPVPTDVELGPDGAYYVTSLPGGPELPGTGTVWRIDPATGAMTQVAGGLSFAVDLAIADDGTMYVAQLFDGVVSQIVGGAPVPYLEIPGPTAIEFGPDGTMYVATGLVGPGAVYRVTP